MEDWKGTLTMKWKTGKGPLGNINNEMEDWKGNINNEMEDWKGTLTMK